MILRQKSAEQLQTKEIAWQHGNIFGRNGGREINASLVAEFLEIKAPAGKYCRSKLEMEAKDRENEDSRGAESPAGSIKSPVNGPNMRAK